MKVKMLTISAGPEGTFQVGSLRDLPKGKAEELIRGGFARAVKEEKAAPDQPEPVIETTEAPPAPERAVTGTSRRRTPTAGKRG